MQAQIGISELDQREREAQELHELERFVREGGREGGEEGEGGERVPTFTLLYLFLTRMHMHTHTLFPVFMHRDIVDLHDIQQELAGMVHDQGEDIDRIGI